VQEEIRGQSPKEFKEKELNEKELKEKKMGKKRVVRIAIDSLND